MKRQMADIPAWLLRGGDSGGLWVSLITGTSLTAVLATLFVDSPGTNFFLWYLFFIPVVLAGYHYHQKGIIFSAGLGITYLVITTFRSYPDIASPLAAVVPFISMIALSSLVSVFGYSIYEQQVRDREAIDRAPAGAFLLRREGHTIAEVNQKFADILGYARDDIQGKPISRIWPYSDDREQFFASTQPGEDSTLIETRFVDSSGAMHWLALSGRCLNHGIISCQVSDITRYKQAEEALNAERRRLFSVLDTLPAYISLQTPDYTIRFANRTFKEIFGDPTGKFCYEVLHGSRKPCNPCKASIVFDLRSPHRWEWDHTNGKTYEVYAYPFTDADGSQLMLQLGIDITQRVQAEEALKMFANNLQTKNQQLEVLRKQLSVVNQDLDMMVRERTADVEKLLKQKDEFISQLGHDLKTPLTPLVALVPRILQQEQDPKLKRLLEITSHNVIYMRELVEKTLKLARMNSLYIELDLEPLSLRAELNKVLQNYAFTFKENGITLKNNIPASIVVRADRILVGEIFDNLITNAIKYMKRGTGTGAISIDASRQQQVVIVAVKDTGIGMTREQLDQVFNEFYKADASRHDLDSPGLGLSICRRIIERHGGRIWAESAGPGMGSTIFFALPAAEEERTEP
jgi:PAS domain S-box-containing protein